MHHGEDGADDCCHPPAHPVVGSGVEESWELNLAGVTSLAVEAGFSVRVVFGRPEQATVRVDDNLTGLVATRVDGTLLQLGLRPGARVQDATLTADVTVRTLEQVTAGGVSRVAFGSELVGGDMVLTALGMSEIGGAVRLQQVRAGASGASTVALSGEVRRLRIAASGASQLELAGLTVGDLDITLSGASVAGVTVEDTLAVEVSGASVLRYYGDPRIVRRQSTGASSIGRAGS